MKVISRKSAPENINRKMFHKRIPFSFTLPSLDNLAHMLSNTVLPNLLNTQSYKISPLLLLLNTPFNFVTVFEADINKRRRKKSRKTAELMCKTLERLTMTYEIVLHRLPAWFHFFPR